MDILEQLEKAINEQKTINFDYKGEGIRVGNPHAIFSNKTTGKITVDIFQIDGYSDTRDKVPGWRPFILDSISNIDISDDSFEIAEGYDSHPKTGRYDKAICKIK